MPETNPTDLLNETIRMGEQIHASADDETYGAWNDSVLKLLRVLFGPSSEHFLNFRFPGGAAGSTDAEASPEERKNQRIRNAIERKLNILQDLKSDLTQDKVAASIGWSHSAESLTSMLDELRAQITTGAS